MRERIWVFISCISAEPKDNNTNYIPHITSQNNSISLGHTSERTISVRLERHTSIQLPMPLSLTSELVNDVGYRKTCLIRSFLYYDAPESLVRLAVEMKDNEAQTAFGLKGLSRPVR